MVPLVKIRAQVSFFLIYNNFFLNVILFNFSYLSCRPRMFFNHHRQVKKFKTVIYAIFCKFKYIHK